MKIKTIITAIAVAMVTLSPVMAGNGNGQGNGDGKGHKMKMANELGLSQDQMKQLAQLRTKHRSEMQPMQQQIRTHRAKINELLKSDPVDRAAISKEADKISELHKQLQEKRVNHLLEVKKVMNKDQWIKFLEKDKRGDQHSFNGNNCPKGNGNGPKACKKSGC